jgi:hypothetical protein
MNFGAPFRKTSFENQSNMLLNLPNQVAGKITEGPKPVSIRNISTKRSYRNMENQLKSIVFAQKSIQGLDDSYHSLDVEDLTEQIGTNSLEKSMEKVPSRKSSPELGKKNRVSIPLAIGKGKSVFQLQPTGMKKSARVLPSVCDLTEFSQPTPEDKDKPRRL